MNASPRMVVTNITFMRILIIFSIALMSQSLFEPSSISNICGQRRASPAQRRQLLVQTADTLAAFENAIRSFMRATSFSAKNISSTLSSAGKNLPETIVSLIGHQAALRALVAEGPFGATNISSMLHGVGANLPDAIAALVNRQADLRTLVAEGPFDAENISSMLSSAGKNLPEAIAALVDRQDDLRTILAKGHFDAANISSMLSGAGQNLPVAIDALSSRLPLLTELTRCFQPSEISGRLHLCPPRQLAATIDHLHDAVKPILNSQPRVSRSLNPELAAASPNTHAKGRSL